MIIIFNKPHPFQSLLPPPPPCLMAFVRPRPVIFLLLLLSLVSSLPKIRAQQNQSSTSNFIKPGSKLFPTTHPSSWLSPSRHFAFGFYKQGNNSGFALGIWMISDQNTVVWTANRDSPPVSSNATLHFTKDGTFLLHTGQGQGQEMKMVMPDLKEYVTVTSASMLDTGNFVLYNNESEIIWQSFRFPTDTLLGGQNLSYGYLVSSVSEIDHSSGRFYLAMQFDGNLVAYPLNSTALPQDSYWSTQTFDSGYHLSLDQLGNLCIRKGESNITICLANASHPHSESNKKKKEVVIYRAMLDSYGIFRLYSHSFGISNNKSNMSLEWSSLKSRCDVKGFCGLNSYCTHNGTAAMCVCFPGFVFVDPDNEFSGCYVSSFNGGEIDCTREGLGSFYKISRVKNMKLGGYPYSNGSSMNEENCGKSCKQDCNCGVALFSHATCSKMKLPLTYGRVDPNESVVALVKVRLRIPLDAEFNLHPPLETEPRIIIDGKKKLIAILGVSLGVITFLCSLIAMSSVFVYVNRVRKYKKLSSESSNLGLTQEFSLRPFSYNELEKATDGFKEELGRGSFGAVYKGVISGGDKMVAVKRLERVVEEGEREFRREMSTIGRTHHKNLVRLLGFCIEGTRKLLVYEYMSNGSLADLLFKAGIMRPRPVWKERVRIALDVARGILYLHEECEARIIHCDIKPQNILMDDSGTAKISDFGLAKLLMPNQSGTMTDVRGSGGYLAPEWQKNALISPKVDVYSFGIVLLEIVCCRSNREVNVLTADEVILSYWAYNCFMAGRIDKLVEDEEEEVDMKSLERMVKTGLLCIQDDPNLRPLIKDVILMLEGTMNIPLAPSPTSCLIKL